MLNSNEHEISTVLKLKYRQIKKCFALSLSNVAIAMLINVKMPSIVDILTFITLTLAYLSCEFAFRAHFQYAVRTYDLKCVENANQEYSYVLGSVSALTNKNCLFRKKRY